MTRAPLWAHLAAWVAICIALTAAMIVTAMADEIMICDQDIPVALRLLQSPPDGYRLRKQYYDPLTKAWYAEFEKGNSTIIVKQTISEAFWTEANQ